MNKSETGQSYPTYEMVESLPTAAVFPNGERVEQVHTKYGLSLPTGERVVQEERLKAIEEALAKIN